jgi:SAM-dependent methyltransferase
LLDVACGSGKFPEALQDFGGVGALSGELQVDYDLLDPSPFSLLEAAQALRPPFVAAARHQTLMEDLDDAVGPFDVVWATHALYALTPGAVHAAVARMLAALAPGGALLIAQGSHDGHYLTFYRHFLDDLREGQGTMYAASEDLAQALRAGGADIRVVRLSYDQTIALEDGVTVEGYLQRCAFDDAVSLQEMMMTPHLGAYLRDCRDEDQGLWRFHQEVDVLLLGSAFDGLIQ